MRQELEKTDALHTIVKTYPSKVDGETKKIIAFPLTILDIPIWQGAVQPGRSLA